MSILNAQSTLTNLLTDTNRVYYEAARKNLGSDKLNRQGFLRVIMAQLQNQDPTNPTDNAQFMSQQLMMEQTDMMNDLVESNKFSQGGSLVGRYVQVPDAPWNFEYGAPGPNAIDVATGRPIVKIGQVEAVQWDNASGKALLKIGDHYYNMDQVQQVFNQDPLAYLDNPSEP